MKMDFDACAEFLRSNEDNLLPGQIEKAIGIMDFQIEIYELWNERLAEHMDVMDNVTDVGDEFYEEEFFDGKEMAFKAVKAAVEKRLSEYVMSLKKELDKRQG